MSESIFALINNGIIVNTIVADQDFINLIENNFEKVVEITNVTPLPGIDWTVYENGYRPPKPHESWLWNGQIWEAPIPMPETGGPWAWNEEAQEWIDLTSQTT